jgi:hypothetical protein
MSTYDETVVIKVRPLGTAGEDDRDGTGDLLSRFKERPDTVKVTWESPPTSSSDPWKFQFRELEPSVDAMRGILNELSDLYVAAWTAAERPDRRAVQKLLVRLARQGQDLHRGLFSEAPKELRDHLRRRNTLDRPYDITIVVTPLLGELILPWGLIFDPRVKVSSKTTDGEFQAGFWCTGRRLATVFQSRHNYLPPPSKKGGVLSVISRKALEESCGRTDGWPKSSLYYSWRKLTDCGSTTNRDRVLHVFCHGLADCLVIETREGPQRVTSAEFRFYASQRPDDVVEIPILNACGTAHFIASGDWLTHLWSHGLRGFIGSEANVPAAFAWDFGRDLVRALLSDKVDREPVSKVLHRLRVKHWPLSLLYGLYADPKVSFRDRVDTHYIPDIENWCESLGGKMPASDARDALP